MWIALTEFAAMLVWLLATPHRLWMAARLVIVAVPMRAAMRTTLTRPSRARPWRAPGKGLCECAAMTAAVDREVYVVDEGRRYPMTVDVTTLWVALPHALAPVLPDVGGGTSRRRHRGDAVLGRLGQAGDSRPARGPGPERGTPVERILVAYERDLTGTESGH